MEYGTNDPEALARLKELRNMTAESKAALGQNETPPPATWDESIKRMERNQRHWQVFLAALTGLSFHEGIIVDIVANALSIADEADRQYRVPEDVDHE